MHLSLADLVLGVFVEKKEKGKKSTEKTPKKVDQQDLNCYR